MENQAQKPVVPSLAEKVAKQFADVVKSAIGGDKNHGWGVEDSFEVIDVLIAENADEIAKAKGLPEEVGVFIKQVINPSQFRQKLETKKILNKNVSKNEKIDDIFSAF